VDGDGTVLLQTEVPTDPQAIAEAVGPYRRTLRRAGHEADALSPWLQEELLALGLPVIEMDSLLWPQELRQAEGCPRHRLAQFLISTFAFPEYLSSCLILIPSQKTVLPEQLSCSALRYF